MKKTTIKQLLFIFALLLGGASSAWADYSPIYQRTTESGENQWSEDIGEGKWVSSGDTRSAASCSASGLTVTESGYSRALTKTIAPTINAKLKLEAQWIPYTSSGSGSYSNYTYFKFGDNFILKAYPRSKTLSLNINGSDVITGMKPENNEVITINLTVNTNSHEITAFTLVGTETTEEVLNINKSLTDISESYRTFLSTTTYTSLVLGVSKTGTATNATTTLKSVTVSEEEQVISQYEYTVNYKEGETVVKTVSGGGDLNSFIPVVSASNAFYGDDMTSSSGLDYTSQKFFIIADVAPTQQITSTPASNVLNIPVRRPYSSTLTVTRYFDGVPEETPFINGTALSETDEKVANWVFTFPYYVQKDDKWYKATLKGEGNDKFGETGTFTNDAVVKTITYTYDGYVTNFWDYSHSGITNNINYSGGSKNDFQQSQSVGTLTAGCYEVTVMQDANYSAYLYKNYVNKDDKGTQLGSQFTSSNRTQIIELNADASGVMIYSGSNSRYDYVLIRKVTSVNVASCDALGYTFSSTYPLDFTGSSIKAYIAKYTSGDVVTLYQVNKVPANTGLFIKSSSSLSNVSIPTTTAATDNVTGNVLVAQSTTGKVAQSTDTKTNYVLGLVSETPTFLKVPTAGVEVAAGKAYLSINYSAALSRMNIVFEDEATGISDATHLNENGKMTNANYYDLSGRRVAQPTKGLYIVNGKKVVIK